MWWHYPVSGRGEPRVSTKGLASPRGRLLTHCRLGHIMNNAWTTRHMSISDRLSFYTNKTDTCWNWTGSNHKSYGKILINGKSHYTHRISYEISVGPIPKGLHVLHRCDNPACINPEHLFLGTPLDNALDRKLKGRNNSESRSGDNHFTKNRPDLIARGEKCGSSRLKESEVREIRRLHSLGESKMSLSNKFNTARSNISSIVNFKAWKHISA